MLAVGEGRWVGGLIGEEGAAYALALVDENGTHIDCSRRLHIKLEDYLYGI